MKISEIAELLTYLSPIILFLSVYIGAYFFKHLDFTHRVLFFYLSINLIIDLLSRFLESISHNNLFLLLVISILEIVSFSLLYNHLINKKKIIWLLFFVGIGYISYEFYFVDFQNTTTLQLYSKVVVSFLIVTMVIVYFTEVLYRENKIVKPLINLNVLIMSYFTLEIILLLPLNFLINSAPKSIFYIWSLRIIILVLFYLILTFFLWNHGKNRKLSLYGS